MLVELSTADVRMCRELAIEQRRQVLGGQHRVPMRTGDDAVRNHTLGNCGQLAFARWLGEEFDPDIGRFKDAPDQSGCQVRTRRRMDYDLIIRPEDPLDCPWVLVCLESEEDARFDLAGWTWGRWVEAWPLSSPDGRRPARFVPRRELRRIETLPHFLERLKTFETGDAA